MLTLFDPRPVAPCFCCGTLIEPGEERMEHDAFLRGGSSVSMHVRCTRTAPPWAASWRTCAICGEAVDRGLARSAAAWLVGFEERMRQTVLLPPMPLRFVSAPPGFLGARLPAMTAFVGQPLLEGKEAVVERIIRPSFELVHARCNRS